ncbi:DapH/DapD/GlmU-related protein [uncultured Eubacterium sp.]|uniref:acyltransferase n=1 Tax=uncultured Eubacterium sp. TaxID=165185 RepID=UPI00259803B4|nr:acyltransferase [uncultured Eubacterium sp.]
MWSPNNTNIDTQRLHMLHIGDYVKITSNVTILTHDYSRSVLAMYCHENIGEARMTYIGDNVFIGMGATVLMGTHIGNNSIVGAGAVVSGQFPDGVVIAGNPAKVIFTIDEYVEKRKEKTLEEAVLFATRFLERKKRQPSIDDMTNAFSWLYLPHTKETIDRYPHLFKLNGVDRNQFVDDFFNSKPVFESFDKFLEYVEQKKMSS